MAEITYEDLTQALSNLEQKAETLGGDERLYLQKEMKRIRAELQTMLNDFHRHVEKLNDAHSCVLLSLQERLPTKKGQEYVGRILAALWNAGETGVAAGEFPVGTGRYTDWPTMARINEYIQGGGWQIFVTKEKTPHLSNPKRSTIMNRYTIRKVS